MNNIRLSFQLLPINLKLAENSPPSSRATLYPFRDANLLAGFCSPDNMDSASISVRQGFRWADAPEKPWEEQTSTLVLTTPSSHFIDIRVYRDITQPNDPCLFLPSGTTTARLEWAFAGTSSSQMVEDQSGNPVRVCRWEHWVDSRVALGAEPQDDSGHMYELEDGTTLEKGVMKDTSTGQQTPYEELWKDMPIEATAADGSKVSILARMEGAQNSRGIIIRVGRWVQGILVKDGEVSVERWKWHEESGKFGCAVRIGRHNVPCFIAFDDESKFEIGKSLELDGMVWKVLEKYQ